LGEVPREGTVEVHKGVSATIVRSVRKEAAVVMVVGEVMTEIAATMNGGGGLEAGVQDEAEDEAEAQGNREIGARLGKTVLREEQRLNSGIGKGNKQNLLTRMVIVTMVIMTTMAIALHRMENSMITLSSRMEVTTTNPSGIVWFGVIVCRASLQDQPCLASRTTEAALSS